MVDEEKSLNRKGSDYVRIVNFEQIIAVGPFATGG